MDFSVAMRVRVNRMVHLHGFLRAMYYASKLDVATVCFFERQLTADLRIINTYEAAACFKESFSVQALFM